VNLAALTRLGVVAVADGERLLLDGPARVLKDEALLAQIRAAKPRLMAELRRCRAWRIRFTDGGGCFALHPPGCGATEMMAIAREQFGDRVVSVERTH
jgi:hypothetical protein